MPNFRSLNKVTLIGLVGDTPQQRSTGSGSNLVNFSIATNEHWTDKQGEKQQRTEWHRIVAWGRNADACSTYLHKGSLVYVEGKIRTNDWTDKKGVEHTDKNIEVIRIVPLDPKNKNPQQEMQPDPVTEADGMPLPEDDLPF